MTIFSKNPPEEYRVKIQLDTQILSYLIDGFYPNLNKSIYFLKSIPFVDILSTEYAYFELFGVRKKELYLREIYNVLKDTTATVNISSILRYHQNFNYDICKYEEGVKARVEETVNKELERLLSEFGIEWKHIFHKGLAEPTKDLCLKSKVSSQDSLILVSSVFPDGIVNEEVVIWTNDNDFHSSFEEVREEEFMNQIFDNKIPRMHFIKRLPAPNKEINLTNLNKDENELYEDLTSYIKALIMDRGDLIFLGKTFRYRSERPKTVYFKLPPNTTITGPQLYLSIIDKNLNCLINSKLITEFWLNGSPLTKENYPFISMKEEEISFEWNFSSETGDAEEKKFSQWVHSNNHLIFLNN